MYWRDLLPSFSWLEWGGDVAKLHWQGDTDSGHPEY
jgi:hypothetical protein